MKLILAGCEYSGTTTLANAISKWAKKALGADFGVIHDHWKIPHTCGHTPTDEVHFLTEEEQQQALAHARLPTEEEQQQILALSPKLKENTQRQSLVYHTPSEPTDHDSLMIGYVFDEAVYAPLYFGYGAPGGLGDRSMYGRHLEHRLLKAAPETVLVHVKASPEVIAQRMKANPHHNGVLQEQDIEHVLKRFEEEVCKSLIGRRITLDTSTATVEETLAEFVEKMEAHLTQNDCLRMLNRRFS